MKAKGSYLLFAVDKTQVICHQMEINVTFLAFSPKVILLPFLTLKAVDVRKEKHGKCKSVRMTFLC